MRLPSVVMVNVRCSLLQLKKGRTRIVFPCFPEGESERQEKGRRRIWSRDVNPYFRIDLLFLGFCFPSVPVELLHGQWRKTPSGHLCVFPFLNWIWSRSFRKTLIRRSALDNNEHAELYTGGKSRGHLVILFLFLCK